MKNFLKYLSESNILKEFQDLDNDMDMVDANNLLTVEELMEESQASNNSPFDPA